tara:strand:+ start:904 stop:1206 length:303 start_codon:yes stop_codon:yes gene_type:complete
MNFKQWMKEGGWIGDDSQASDVNTRGAYGSGTLGSTTNGPSKHPNPPPGMATPSSNAPFALAQKNNAAPVGQAPAQTGMPIPQQGQQPQIKRMKKKMKKR